MFCENETNEQRLFGAAPLTPYPKDGINDHVVSGAATVNPDRAGTKAAFWYQLTVPAGETAELRLRLRQPPAKAASGRRAPLGRQFDEVIAQRRAEADEFYAELTPAEASADEAMVMRQAFAGMLWSKQLFYYDVARWLDGDPTQPTPPAQRLTGRNSRWRNFDAFDIMSMPDKWEYPWYAAWDLAFHCVALAHVDPAFAKYQLILLCREWFQHPNGALPAYEWDFGDVNPPVQAWAAVEVFAIDGARDIDFISRIFDKLLVNFTWWVNREDAEGNNLFEGGFLGLDNIGPIDRSHLPVGGILEQSDATGWMGFYAIAMASMAVILNRSGQRPGVDLVLKFLEHFAAITEALEGLGLWDETDGLYYDRLLTPSGEAVPVKVRSMVGIIPILAAAVIDENDLQISLTVGKQFADFMARRGLGDREKLSEIGLLRGEQRPPAAVAQPGRGGPAGEALREALRRERVLVPARPAGAVGLPPRASVRARCRGHPGEHRLRARRVHYRHVRRELQLARPALVPAQLPGDRGPGALLPVLRRRVHIEYPTGSGVQRTLDKVAADLQDRLISIFTEGPDGRRPCFGGTERLQHDPAWHDNLIFSEYFHGDNGAAIGAFHQTGWTGLIADVIRRRHGAVDPVGDAIRRIGLDAER